MLRDRKKKRHVVGAEGGGGQLIHQTELLESVGVRVTIEEGSGENGS